MGETHKPIGFWVFLWRWLKGVFPKPFIVWQAVSGSITVLCSALTLTVIPPAWTTLVAWLGIIIPGSVFVVMLIVQFFRSPYRIYRATAEANAKLEAIQAQRDSASDRAAESFRKQAEAIMARLGRCCKRGHESPLLTSIEASRQLDRKSTRLNS